MSATTVISIGAAPRDFWEWDEYVYIGRPGYFGNPVIKFKVCPVCGGTHTANGATLPCYERWLVGKLLSDPEFYNKLSMLRGKILVCYCKPKPCHGDIIIKYLDGAPHGQG